MTNKNHIWLKGRKIKTVFGISDGPIPGRSLTEPLTGKVMEDWFLWVDIRTNRAKEAITKFDERMTKLLGYIPGAKNKW